MRTLLIIFLLGAMCVFESKASDTLRYNKSIATTSTFFTTDPIGNIYVVNEDNSLIKYNSTGDSIGIFNQVRKGNITHVDATNPLRLLIYFSDYGQIVILDNMLSIKSVMKLPTIGLQNVRCVATSKDGKVWVYDQAEARLLKIDDKLNIQFSAPLRNMLNNPIDPIYMVEQERNLYLIDSLQGISKFDLFGFYNTSYAFQTHELQCFNADMVFVQANELVSYNTQTISEKKISLPLPEQILQTRIERNKLYIRRAHSIDIYYLN